MKIKPNDYSSFRKHLGHFIKVNDDEFAEILKYFSVKRLKKNQVLVRPGEKVSFTYWVVKGWLTSNFIDDRGKEHIIQFANEDCWVTDQNAFYNQEKATFGISCVEDSEVLCLSYDNRERLCTAIHKMEYFFRKKANDSFVKQQKRLLTYLTSDARKRYELLLIEFPTLIQRLPKKTLAAYLGVSRETLSRFRR